MNNFRVISKKFFNQYRNGVNFTDNLTEFTDRLQGNVGEKLKLVEEIEVSTIVNEQRAIEMTYVDNSTSASLISDLLNFELEGLFNGANLSIDFNGSTFTATVENITGSSKQELVLDSASNTNLKLAGILENQCYEDIVIKVTDAPTYLTYKYGINDNTRTTPNYISPLDTNEQAYYLNGISGVLGSMDWVGSEIGSSLGSVQVKFDNTVDLYKHQFTIEHEFILPYYTQEQNNNIIELKNPSNLQSSNSLKYGNGFFFGVGKNDTTLVFEDTGKIGNVGYFGENFSGKVADYELIDYVVNNPSKTGKIEATEVNTVTFSIQSNTPTGFLGGEKIIVNTSKLTTEQDYSRQKESFEDVWLFESLEQTEGDPIVNGTIITGLLVNFDAISGYLDVQMSIQYTADQQLKIKDTDQSLFYVTIATENLADPDLQNRSNVTLPTEVFTVDEQVNGLVTNWQPEIYEQWDTTLFNKAFTNFDGFNGDLLYIAGGFDLDLTRNARIVNMTFEVVADTGTENFLLKKFTVPIGQVVTAPVGGTDYQVLNLDLNRGFNMDSGTNLNRFILSGIIPLVAGTEQSWTFATGFNVPWRDWVQNINVPTSFIDTNEPNDNRNEKSSNYSGIDGYDIKTSLVIGVQSDATNGDTVITSYELLSDTSRILDYDTANAGFSAGDVKFYNYLNVEQDDIDSNIDGRIEIEFTHSLGVIPVGDIAGYIKIEVDQSTQEPFYLSTDIDLTRPNSPLTPSDTLTTGNTQFVEVVSVNNLVTFICNTNALNLSEVDYNIYGRISNKT